MVDAVALSVGGYPPFRWPLPGAPVWSLTARDLAGPAPEDLQRRVVVGWVRHMPDLAQVIGEHGQAGDAQVHTYRCAWSRGCLLGALDLDLERDEPPSVLKPDRGRQDAGSAGYEAAVQLSRGLVGADRAQSEQCHVPPVGLQADGAGGEPARQPGLVLGLQPGHADRLAFALTSAGLGTVVERGGGVRQAGAVRLL